MSTLKMSIPESEKPFGMALLALDGMGPARIARLKSKGGFQKAWDFILQETSEKIAEAAKVGLKTAQKWKQTARVSNPQEFYEKHSQLEKAFFEDSNYPPQLLEDLEPPTILFARGSSSLNQIFSGRRTVGIVGTRNCTRYGADIAFELGRELSLAGVVVVSGLAIGIDNAAHFGSTSAVESNPESAPSAAVVGCGLDIVYPKRSEKLYNLVSQNGAIISEAPLGALPQKWRFPSRNRIIAGLSEVLVVVESHSKGGALITAEESGIRGKSVMAVPGSIRSQASTGTNRLISEGCQPLTEIADVFLALDMVGHTATAPDKGSSLSEHELSEHEQALLDAFCWEVVDEEILIQRCGFNVRQVIALLESLIAKGVIARRGLNFERCQSPLDL